MVVEVATCCVPQTIYAVLTPMLLLQATLYGSQAAEPLPPAVIKAIAKELKDLQEKPEEGIKVWLQTSLEASAAALVQCVVFVQLILSEDNIADVQAEYEGPGTLLCL